jgi:hypothetical protein
MLLMLLVDNGLYDTSGSSVCVLAETRYAAAATVGDDAIDDASGGEWWVLHFRQRHLRAGRCRRTGTLLLLLLRRRRRRRLLLLDDAVVVFPQAKYS